jgi:transcriptional regulator with XRE-family HTH domain
MRNTHFQSSPKYAHRALPCFSAISTLLRMSAEPKDDKQAEPPDPLQIALGKTVRAFRKKSGLNQIQLGAEADVDQSTISRIENGEIWPELPTLVRIAKAFGLSAYLLLEEAEKRTGDILGREGATVGRKWQNAPPHAQKAFVVLLDRIGPDVGMSPGLPGHVLEPSEA